MMMNGDDGDDDAGVAGFCVPFKLRIFSYVGTFGVLSFLSCCICCIRGAAWF
jgi:hypothetical protein